MAVAGIILSAGGSTRMGTCKALLKHPSGATMLEAHVQALSSCCTEIIIVAGAHYKDIQARLPAGCQLVKNPDWNKSDPFASLVLGLKETCAKSVLVTPVDTPPATTAELSRLLDQPHTAVLSWQEQAGHPVLLRPDVLARIHAGEQPRSGLRSFLEDAHHVPAKTPAAIASWNTLKQWQAWHDSTRA